MKNKIVTLLCILTILITTGIVAANSDGVQHTVNGDPQQSILIEQVFCDAYGNPIVNDTEPLMPGHLKNRCVSVRNISNTPVFVRTVFAFEAGNLTLEQFHRDFEIQINSGENAEWQWIDNNDWKSTKWDGKNYFVTSATYKSALTAGSATQASLLEFGLAVDATNGTVEQFNDNYTLMVCSQAVQADGWKIDGNNIDSTNAGTEQINRILDKAFGQIDNGYQADWGNVTTQ